MKSRYAIIPPHEDIKHGDFDEAIFAANLADVHAGVAPKGAGLQLPRQDGAGLPLHPDVIEDPYQGEQITRY